MRKIVYCLDKTSSRPSLPFSFDVVSTIKELKIKNSPIIIIGEKFLTKLKDSNLVYFKDKLTLIHFLEKKKSNLKTAKNFGFLDFFTDEDKKADITFKLSRANEFLVLKNQIKDLQEHILGKNKKIENMLIFDPTTNCYNWRYFLNRAHQELSSSRRHTHSVSFVAVDVDSFRQINEIYGVEVADYMAKELVRILKNSLRSEDALCRWRGDEFFLIIPHLEGKNVRRVARRIKDRITSQRFKYKDLTLRIKVSVAVVSSPEDNIYNIRDAVSALDKCLTFSKRRGGNAIVLYSQLDSKHAPKEKDKKETAEDLRKKIKRMEVLLTRDLLEMIYGFARAIEAKDSYTGEHVEYTAALAEEIAISLKLPDSEVENIKHAAVLHDLGKVGISESILSKNGPLTAKEREVINTHPSIATEILREIRALRGAVPAVLYHHEKFDGTGYPLGLKGDEIPLGARIVAIADVYQALVTDRPYRKAFTRKKAVGIIRKEAGKQFDPNIVKIFLKTIGEVDEKARSIHAEGITSGGVRLRRRRDTNRGSYSL